MKYRYLVFSYPMYYPGGDMSDLVIKTNNRDEAINAMQKAIQEGGEYRSGTEIYDCEVGEVIEEG